MSDPQYYMPVAVIKKLLSQENKVRVDAALRILHYGKEPNSDLWWFYLDDYFRSAITSTQNEIKAIDSYSDANIFIGTHYRMRLEDWIASIKDEEK